MRSVIEFLVHFILAITGALGVAIGMAALFVALGGCALLGSGWCWRLWSRRRRSAREKPEP
jgi:organic radical activating enzyme